MTLQTGSGKAPPPAGAAEPIWFASYPPGIPKSIDPDTYPSLSAMLLDACARHAAHPAFECLGVRMTYTEWERLSRGFAAFLIEEVKCRPGDRVAIMLPNLLAYPVAFLGALRAGLTVVNVNPLYTPRELKEQLDGFGRRRHRHHGEFRAQARIGAGRDADSTRGGGAARRFHADAQAPAVQFRQHIYPACGAGLALSTPSRCCTTPAAAARARTTRTRSRKRHRRLLLQYTGGTTGVPKGAMLTHRNLVANTLQCRAVIAPYLAEEQGSVLTPLPLYHIFSLTANLLAFALMGGLSVLVPDPRDIKGLIRTMRRAQVSTMTGVNTLFNALINTPEFAALDFSKLNFAVGGGAAVQSAVAVRWREITGTELVEGYGLTEASPVVCLNPVRKPADRHRRLAGAFDRSRDPRRCGAMILPVGEAGEICVRGPQVMQGYWQRPDETKLVLSADGWLHTGDIGAFDADGYLKILDRKKDMVNVSGFKVFPNEVEDVIAQHPGVLEAAVIGVADPHTGQGVKLFVVKRDPALTEADLTKFARERLAAYKMPKVIVFVDSLPKSNVGKIIRKDLK